MNRRSFFKLLGIVPLAPFVLAAMPIAEVPNVITLKRIKGKRGWAVYYSKNTHFKNRAELRAALNAAYERADFHRPIRQRRNYE